MQRPRTDLHRFAALASAVLLVPLFGMFAWWVVKPPDPQPPGQPPDLVLKIAEAFFGGVFALNVAAIAWLLVMAARRPVTGKRFRYLAWNGTVASVVGLGMLAIASGELIVGLFYPGIEKAIGDAFWQFALMGVGLALLGASTIGR